MLSSSVNFNNGQKDNDSVLENSVRTTDCLLGKDGESENEHIGQCEPISWKQKS